MRFLGLDIGTTSLKAAVFDETGKRLGLITTDYVLDTDPITGFIEFSPEEYIKMTKSAIDSLTNQCGKIDAISIDTQGETIIFADSDFKPVYPAIVWLDTRATKEANEIREHFTSKRVYEITGQPEVSAGWPSCTTLWLKHNRPEIWNRTKKIMLIKDWVIYALTGCYTTEPTMQSSSIWFDISKYCWWTEMLEYIGIDETYLPKLTKSTDIAGYYNGVPVISGALDQIAGTIGTGVTDEKRISTMTGTIMAICAMTDKIPEFREDSIIPCHTHAIDGKYCMLLWSSTAGMALKWFKNNLAENLSFKELDELAEKVSPGCDGVTMLPYFSGSTMPKYNPEARAVFAGLNLSHGKGHMARSIMEAVAYILKQDIEYIGNDRIEEIRITGGGASSPLWSQIDADVTQKILHTVSESETACLGSAIIAAVGIGAFKSIEEAANGIVSVKKEYRPSDADYTDGYNRFCALDGLMNI